MNSNMFMIDADIVYFRDPWPEITIKGEEDFIYSTDARDFYDNLNDPFEGLSSIPRICGGFFLAKSNKRTFKIFEDMMDVFSLNPLANDQTAMDNLLNSRDSVLIDPPFYVLKNKNLDEDTVKVRILDQLDFVNGAIFLDHSVEYWERIFKRKHDNPQWKGRVFVHGNWWKSDKFKEFMQLGMWYLKEDGTCPKSKIDPTTRP